MNELIRLVARMEELTIGEAIDYIRETYAENGKDAERTLWDLGVEEDYCFDLYEIVA